MKLEIGNERNLIVNKTTEPGNFPQNVSIRNSLIIYQIRLFIQFIIPLLKSFN